MAYTIDDSMLKGFLACALWTSHMDDDEAYNFDEKSIYDFTDEAFEKLAKVVEDFQEANEELIEQLMDDENIGYGTIGHSLWLSRNGHGAGFFDYSSEAGDKLHEIVQYNEQHLWINEEGKVDLD